MSNKVMFIGIDGAIPKMIKRFDDKGIIPNISALMKKGCFSEMLSQIPVATPINWASLSTGSVPGVHNVTGFWCHHKGDRLDQYTSEEAFTNSFVRAERIWESVERQGGRSVVMKFPGSWPPSVKTGTQVDGYCIPSYNASTLDLASNGCYAVQDLYMAKKLVLGSADDWKNIEQYSYRAAASFELELKNGCQSLQYHLLAVGKQKFEKILLCHQKDAQTAFAVLSPGQWSQWECEPVAENMTGSVRFKLISLSGDGTDLRLYHSQVYPSRGFTYPDELGSQLQKTCGPMLEFASAHAWKYGWTDIDTCYEEADYQVKWLSKASQQLLSQPWNFFITQFHWVDHIQHYFLPMVDPSSPIYRPEREAWAWGILEQGYHLADELVGNLIKLADEDTSIFVLSDHGNICDEYTVSLLPLFIQKGLIKTRLDENGKRQIDWSKTVAYPCKPGNCDVYINLKGRDAEGCVDPKDYEVVRSRVISIMRDFTAPNGKKVYDQVLRKEDAMPLGIYGEYAGDIIAVYTQGISWAGHGGEEWEREDAVFAPSSENSLDYGAHHGPTSPAAETEICSNKAFLVAAGRGIRKNYDRSKTRLGPVRVLDIAPTISHLLSYYPPRENQGAVIGDFLEE